MNKTKEIYTILEKLIKDPTCPLDYNRDYELLIAVMLSSQTTDKRVNEVTKILFLYNLQELAALDISTIENIIKPIGTYHKKAKYVKDIAKILIDKCNGKIAHDRKFIESLPGVGHKTCNVVFAELFNDDTIAVDTHVTRVSKRLGLVNKSASPLEIENKLMEIFPKENWSKLHLLLVLFGRNYCKSKNPKCEGCPLKKYCIIKD